MDMDYYTALADRLLKDGLLLTALELYIEFAERGKCLQPLKRFFDDSANFDQFTRKPLHESPVPSITGSQQTLEDGASLFDLRYNSEDSIQHHSVQSDRVAVLEFELRRATQTINSLRSELTLQAKAVRRNSGTIGTATHKDQPMLSPLSAVTLDTSDMSTLVKPGDAVNSEGPPAASEVVSVLEADEDTSLELLGHEKRTLNYLVNEYLLTNGYKLTAITFSDENSDEDFEDWESIGLNVSKPPDLGRIYREFANGSTCFVGAKKPGQSLGTEHNRTEPAKGSPPETKEISVQVDLSPDHEGQIEALKMQLEAAEASNETLEKGALDAAEKFKILQQKIEELESFKAEPCPSKGSGDEESCPRESTESEESLETNLSADRVAFYNFLVTNLDLPRPQSPTEKSLTTTNSFNDVIDLISDSLHEIVPHVLLARRSTVLPLILTAIKHHKTPEKRDKLLNMLFNLTKRPDQETRSVIVAGFVEIAQTNRTQIEADTVQIEAELLPQLWGQIEHKYLERRVLVAQTCLALTKYIPHTIRDSLVFSMLQQLMLQDREPEVKLSACDAMATLVLYIRDEEKLNVMVPKILTEALTDVEIVTRVLTGLLLTFAKCCKPQTLQGFVQSMAKSAVSESLPPSEVHLHALNNLIPFVISNVIADAPFYRANNLRENETSDVASHSNALSVLMPHFEDTILPKLRECMSSFEPWPRLKWIKENLLEPLVDSATLVPATPANTGSVLQLVSIFRATSYIFGTDLMKAKFSVKLENFMDRPSELSSALLPVYYLGLMAESGTETTAMLHDVIVRVCETSPERCDGLIFTVAHMLDHDPSSAWLCDGLTRMQPSDDDHRTRVRDSLCEMTWALVVNQSPTVRSFAGLVLNILASSDHEDLIGTKILPALVTLSSDPECGVQKAAIPGLGQVVCAGLGSGFYCMTGSGSSGRISNETRDKATFQLVSKISGAKEDQHDLLKETALTIGKILSFCNKNTEDLNSMAVRDEVMLPKLAAINDLYVPPDFGDTKCLDMANTLLSIYKSVVLGGGGVTQPESTQTVTIQRLPSQVYQTSILPSLMKIGKDFHRLGIVAQETSTIGLINQLEAYNSGNGSTSVASSMLANSPSMDEVKSKVGKLFNRPSGSFWSKK